MKLGKRIVACRIPILILALALLLPSVIGMAATRINYDMLTYLPDDIDTVTGQDILMDEFGKGAFFLRDRRRHGPQGCIRLKGTDRAY